MKVLGVSGFFHDAAAALVEDGVILAAAENERFTRRKHDPDLPAEAIAWIGQEHDLSDLDAVVFYERPLLRLQRGLVAARERRLAGALALQRSLLEWGRRKLWVEAELRAALEDAGGSLPGRLLYSDHHLSHAASAFYPSPFETAAVLTVDGVGEWETSTLSVGVGEQLTKIAAQRYPHSLGLFYAAMTQLAGFKVNSGEYKLMGLAPYGEPRFVETLLEQVIRLDADGGVELNTSMFGFPAGISMVGRRLEALIAQTRRGGDIREIDCDIAASAQVIVEQALGGMAAAAVRRTGYRRLVLAGGVALNCVAVGKLLADGVVDDLWVQPAASDAGGALGAAYAGLAAARAPTRPHLGAGDAMRGTFLGPAITTTDAANVISELGLQVEHIRDREAMDYRIAELLAAGKTVALARGRAEFGPRALGNRSILADPRDPGVQRRLNLDIKGRESFRPFAPAVRAADAARWFDLPPSKHMTIVSTLLSEHRRDPGPPVGELNLRTAQIRSTVPAVTHLDYSARPQLVEPGDPLDVVLTRFAELTDVPLVVNTSFNRRGEPIVNTALDAYICFAQTKLDVLVLDEYLLERSTQPPLPECLRSTPEAD